MSMLFRGLLGILAAGSAFAAEAKDPLLPLLGRGTSSLSLPLQILALLTALTLLPAIIMSVTPFLRISVVLHFLRQALGTQNTPSNQVLIGLALFLTILIVQPVATEMYAKGWQPMERGN